MSSIVFHKATPNKGAVVAICGDRSDNRLLVELWSDVDCDSCLALKPTMSRTTGNTPAEDANPEVDHPVHYNTHPSGVECIEIVRHMGFNLGNVVKYLWRDGIKHSQVELQDLEKALWYLQDEIKTRKATIEKGN